MAQNKSFNAGDLANKLIELAAVLRSGEIEYKSGEFTVDSGYPERQPVSIGIATVDYDNGPLHIEIKSNLVLIKK